MPANSFGAFPFSPRRLSGRFPSGEREAGRIPYWYGRAAEAGPPVLIEVFPPPCSERNGYACWICRNGEEPGAISG